jgi:hypothetical protein
MFERVGYMYRCTSAAAKVACGEWWGGPTRGEEAREVRGGVGGGGVIDGGRLWSRVGSKEVQLWAGPLSGGARVLLVVNRGDAAARHVTRTLPTSYISIFIHGTPV